MKTLTQNEAIIKMELSGDQFLIFRSEEDRKLKVIYRRSDDHYGIIAVEG
jgi:putative sigma-54 modulation protein